MDDKHSSNNKEGGGGRTTAKFEGLVPIDLFADNSIGNVFAGCRAVGIESCREK